MAKLYTLGLAVVCALLLPGCASNSPQQGVLNPGVEPFQPPSACLFTQVKAPLSTKFQNTPVCKKKGQASAEHIYVPCYVPCLTFSWGGCDVDTAAKNGNLSKVEYADYEYLSVLQIYKKTTVTAYGE